MPELTTTVTSKGQVTIPREVRVRLGLNPKDKVIFEVEGETARIRKASSKVRRWFGALTPYERPEDFQKIREGFEASVAEEADSRG